MRTYKPRKKAHDRQSLIEQAYRNSIAYKITIAETAEQKRTLVAEHNPTHYIFGETLRPWKPWLTYEENMERIAVTQQLRKIINGELNGN